MTINEPSAPLALSGVRVLEIGCGYAVAYAGKIFADFGAEVIKVETQEDDDIRQIPPLLSSQDHNPQSALNAWLNTNKKSVTFNHVEEDEKKWMSELTATCHVLLDSRALTQGIDILQNSSLGFSNNSDQKASPIEIYLTWFGENGPYSKFVGSDAVCRALAGAVYGSGDPNGPPLLPHDIQTGVVAGVAAFSSAMAALIGAEDGNRRYILSIHEIAFSVVEMEAGMVQDNRHPKKRLGINRFCTTHPGGIYKTQDGWIGLFAHTLPQWSSLCTAIGLPEYASDPRFANGATRMKHADQIDAFLLPALMTKTAQSWFELLSREKFPVVLVPTMEELLVQKVHRERNAFVPIQAGKIKFEGVIVPLPFGDAGPLKGGVAPIKGADDNFYRSKAALRSIPQRKSATQGLAPLRKIRVIDLTMGWAGPFASRTLADFGAEVIKVESTNYPDWWRGTHYTNEFYQERLYEKNSNFALMNRNKLGITLDLTSKEGRDILLDLVKTADILIENYSTEVLPKLGLDYEVLAKTNNRIVMVSMPAFGIGNEWSQIRAYGGTLEQASGLPHHTGFTDQPPSLTSYAYGDPIGGWNASAASLLALFVQLHNKKGRHVNLSQVECMLPFVSPFLLEQSVFGFTRPRQGNFHPLYSPHNIYRCAGEGQWIVLSILDNKQWCALANLLQIPTLMHDESLLNVTARHVQQEKINSLITAWTEQRSAQECMNELQDAGIAAGIVKPIWEIQDDIHLRNRGVFTQIHRDYLGEYLATTPVFREANSPLKGIRSAPTLGEHSQEVLSRVLGISAEQFLTLVQKGITGKDATMKRPA